jgi:dipeptidase E
MTEHTQKMKLLLTSAGITNDSIKKALSDLLGKPFDQCRALHVPTAIYTYPEGSLYAWQGLKQLDLGWKEYGVLELTALASIPEKVWLPAVEAADVLIVGGGNGFYLSYWLQKSGLFEKLPKLLQDKVYIGVSAGSGIVTHSFNVDKEKLEKTGVYFDDEYNEAGLEKASSDKALKLVDFTLRPHMNADYFSVATEANMEKWATKVKEPFYAYDDQTALKVVDGKVEVISEGKWKLFNR